MEKKIYLLGFCLVCSCLSFSQDYNFNEFKFPDLAVRGLSLAGNGRYNDLSNGAKINLNGELSYFSRTNNAQRQGGVNQFLQFTLNPDFFTIQPLPGTVQNDIAAYYGYNSFNRNYKGNKYKEIGIDGQLNLNAFSDNGTYFISTNLSLPLRIGRGRIEDISNVFLANFIMEDLLKTGVLSENLNQDRLFGLGQEIAVLANSRIFDFRNRRIEQIKGICNWLKKDLQDEKVDDLSLFLAVTDNLNYAFVNSRASGKRISFGLSPFISFTKFASPLLDNSINYGLTLNASYLSEKAINKATQISKFVDLGVRTFLDSKSRNITSQPYLDASFGWAWFPNSRTISSLKTGVLSKYNIYDESNPDYYSINPYINYSLNYFVSNNTRLTFGLVINVGIQNLDIGGNDNIRSNFGVNHFFY